MAGPSPTVRQRRLARVLRSLREGAGFTIEQVAEKLDVSPSTISRVETAHVGIRPLDLRVLLDIYEVTGEQRNELLEIARERRKQPWWQEYKDLPKIDFAALEADASSISQYSALLIPGLLQTEAYARAVLDAFRLDTGSEGIEGHLKLRMERQALLANEKGPQYWVILDEAVLRRSVGGREVMQLQIQRLIDAAALPNVTLQVLSFSTGAHPGMDGEFTILRYREDVDPDVVYIENTGGDVYLDAFDVTRRYNIVFDRLQAKALNPAESIRTLTDLHHQLAEPERS